MNAVPDIIITNNSKNKKNLIKPLKYMTSPKSRRIQLNLLITQMIILSISK